MTNEYEATENNDQKRKPAKSLRTYSNATSNP
jgi:hypothetical protein